ncbi:gap junction alpha-9 protein [Clupea harengus]|uniref:Gap junction protein n=1 Tax=Clupea harengus TaxID=7950 RepID=A0A6P8H255_CLUHA|nr:gap junction alpha-9 protein [Clupea harengus]
MGDWNFLGGILEEVHIHSTMVGKIWLTILFIFRMLVLGVAAEDVWNDEQTDFICNTEQPGCRNVCYDRAFPISLIRFWVLQVIFVSSPSLVYMGHAIYQLRALEKERHGKRTALRRELEMVDVELTEVRRRIERELKQVEQGKLNKAPLRGSLLRTYVANIITRSLVEVGFMTGQYLLYGVHLDPLFKCEREPCPNVVDCFVSRPTEKSVFMVFMQGIAAVSLFLSLLEMMHLGYKKLKKGILGYYPNIKEELDDSYISKSKKNSVVQTVCMSSAGRKATIPTTTSGYTLLMEKQGNGPTYPILNATSTFMPIQGNPAGQPGLDMPRDPTDVVLSPMERNSNSNNTSSETRSPPHEPLEEHEGHHAKELEPGNSEYPTLPAEDSLATCSTYTLARKPRRVSAPWACSTVVEGQASDSADSSHGSIPMKPRCSFAASRARAFSKPDLKRLARPGSPDSLGGLSMDSENSTEHSGGGGAALSPDRRMSLASSGSSRRASTDLQI